MPNTISAFFQTLVTAANEATRVLAPTWKTLESVYFDYDDVPATIGQTIDVPIPVDPSASVADQGSGDTTLTDIAFTNVPIVFDQHPSFDYVVRDFEQFNSPERIRNVFLDAAIKGVKTYCNGRITSLLTTGNFTTNAAISTTGHIITTAQFLSGNAILADQKVPVADDPDNMSLLLPSTPYMAVVGDANWTQAQIAGMFTAERVRATGTMPTAYGMSIKLDQQMPTSGTAPSRTFTGALIHRHTIGVVSRPLPAPDGNVVEYTYINFNGLSLRIMVGYNQYPKKGYIVSVEAGFGRKVVRENMGQLFTIAE
jgi:hypothetical protein